MYIDDDAYDDASGVDNDVDTVMVVLHEEQDSLAFSCSTTTGGDDTRSPDSNRPTVAVVEESLVVPMLGQPKRQVASCWSSWNTLHTKTLASRSCTKETPLKGAYEYEEYYNSEDETRVAGDLFEKILTATGLQCHPYGYSSNKRADIDTTTNTIQNNGPIKRQSTFSAFHRNLRSKSAFVASKNASHHRHNMEMTSPIGDDQPMTFLKDNTNHEDQFFYMEKEVSVYKAYPDTDMEEVDDELELVDMCIEKSFSADLNAMSITPSPDIQRMQASWMKKNSDIAYTANARSPKSPPKKTMSMDKDMFQMLHCSTPPRHSTKLHHDIILPSFPVHLKPSASSSFSYPQPIQLEPNAFKSAAHRHVVSNKNTKIFDSMPNNAVGMSNYSPYLTSGNTLSSQIDSNEKNHHQQYQESVTIPSSILVNKFPSAPFKTDSNKSHGSRHFCDDHSNEYVNDLKDTIVQQSQGTIPSTSNLDHPLLSLDSMQSGRHASAFAPGDGLLKRHK